MTDFARLIFPTAIAATFAFAAHAQTLTNSDFRADREDFHETVFGVEISDPYRWMESADRQEDVSDFILQASAHTIAELAALPGRVRLRESTASAFVAGAQYLETEVAGNRTFYRRAEPGEQFSRLVVRLPDGQERTLFDPQAEDGVAISSYQSSPDGSVVAFHTAVNGAEIGEIRFVDVATGNLLPDVIAPVWGEFEAAWFDNRSLAITRMTSSDGPDATSHMQVVFHRLGAPLDDTSRLGSRSDGPAFEPQEFPMVKSSPQSRWVLGLGVGARADQRVMIANRADALAGRPVWREIAGYDDEISYVESAGAAISGDWLYLLSSKEAPNRQVLRINLGRGHGLAEAQIIVAESDAVITGIAATKDGLYVVSQIDGLSHLSFQRHNARTATPIALPMRGSLGYLQPNGEQSGVVFVMQDWLTAPRWFLAEGPHVRSLNADWTSYAGADAWTQLTDQAISADGARVPLAIILPRGAPEAQPRALMLEGYGSYGLNTAEPYYARHYFGLIEEGGAVAFCGTRGGGERGRTWHEAGRGPNKPTAHADFIACGERLVELGLTTPQRMTVTGSSAAGFLAPPAALQRPDLFRSMVMNVASLNPTRLASDPNGPNQYAEMGDPGTEDGFLGLLRTDGFVMLERASDMPDTLLLVGLNDNRVQPWSSAKYAARALERFGDRRLALLRTDPQAGHGAGSGMDVMIETYTDMAAFVFNRAGAAGFIPH